MDVSNEISDEKELILKLLRTGHLSVPERKNLPSGRLRASYAKLVILNELNSCGWFPGSQQLPVGDSGGEYMQLELRPDGLTVLHHNFEYSLEKYDHKTIGFSDVDQGVTAYLHQLEDQQALDGVLIDWES